MRTLALEFSSTRRSVAAIAPGREPVEAVAASVERNTQAFALIADVLKKFHWERHDVECIAVGLGPGSYTGVRVGISIAQGWQIARDVKLIGLSSVDAIAEQARCDGFRGPITCVIDAQRQEFYSAVYELDDAAARPVQPLTIKTFAQAKERAAQGAVIVSPDSHALTAHRIFPTATVIARMALMRHDYLPGERLEPIYLRETAFIKAAPPRFASA
jgi:tRNA threonylcarbamoyl adenosine modification protein YeaZ